MKRDNLLKKMIDCYDSCVLNMSYDSNTAMDRVLDLIEEELNLKFEEKSSLISNDDDDTYCGAV